MHGLDKDAVPTPALPAIHGAYGRPTLSLASRNRQGLILRLHAGSGASAQELAEALKAMLRQLEDEGKGLQL